MERTSSWLKKFNLYGMGLRNRLRFYDRIIDIVCGMINMRMAKGWWLGRKNKRGRENKQD